MRRVGYEISGSAPLAATPDQVWPSETYAPLVIYTDILKLYL